MAQASEADGGVGDGLEEEGGEPLSDVTAEEMKRRMGAQWQKLLSGPGGEQAAVDPDAGFGQPSAAVESPRTDGIETQVDQPLANDGQRSPPEPAADSVGEMAVPLPKEGVSPQMAGEECGLFFPEGGLEDASPSGAQGRSASPMQGRASRTTPSRSPPTRSPQADSRPSTRGQPYACTLEMAANAMFKQRSGANAINAQEEDREMLIHKLRERGDGSFLRGWRRELDPEGDLAVKFPDFLKAATRIKFFGDTLGLFSQNGNLSLLRLDELAPNEGGLLERFRQWCKAEFGFASALLKGLGAEELDAAAFARRCMEKGFEGTEHELQLVFECCDIEGEGVIAKAQVVFLETDADVRAQEMYKLKLGKMMQWRTQASEEYIKHLEARTAEQGRFNKAHRKAPRAWLERYFEQMPTVACYSKHMRQKEAATRARRSRAILINHMRRTYVHEVRALRRALSPNSCEFREGQVRNYCAMHSLNIHVQDLFKLWDGDKDGIVRFEEFAVNEALILARFQKWAKERFGSCAAIWDTPQAATASRNIDGTWFREKSMKASVLKEALRSLGWPGMGDSKVRKCVFNCLDLNGFGMFDRNDLVWLDSWKPMEWVIAEPDEAEWVKLRDLLLRSFGHLLRAWREVLDRDDSNALSWIEFRDACSRLKFEGNAAAAWRHLDTDLSGTITMKEYDANSYDILLSFKEWAEVHFGSIKHCFKCLDVDFSGSLSFKELRDACRRLRFQGNVRVLFDCLHVDRDPGDGKAALAFSEISFLDKWQDAYESDEDDSQYLSEFARKPKKTTKTPKAFWATADRLSSPVNVAKLGYTDWRSASMGSLHVDSLDFSSMQQPSTALPSLTASRTRSGSGKSASPASSPYGEKKLWGREISAMTRPPQRWRKQPPIPEKEPAEEEEPVALPEFDARPRALSLPTLTISPVEETSRAPSAASSPARIRW